MMARGISTIIYARKLDRCFYIVMQNKFKDKFLSHINFLLLHKFKLPHCKSIDYFIQKVMRILLVIIFIIDHCQRTYSSLQYYI